MFTCVTNKKIWVLLLTLTLFSQTGYSQRPGCSTAKADRADREAGRMQTWDALYGSYLRFSACDDGSIAEGYSDSVGRILVEHWDTLPRLSVLSQSNRKFERFVLRHVDATLGTSDLEKIRRNAINSCPSGESELCKKIRLAADDALKG